MDTNTTEGYRGIPLVAFLSGQWHLLWIPVVIVAAVASLLTWDHYDRKNKRAVAEFDRIYAANMAAEKAAWDATTPHQHADAARQALDQDKFSDALRHINALQGRIHHELMRDFNKKMGPTLDRWDAERKANPGARPDTYAVEVLVVDRLKKTAHDPGSVTDVSVTDSVEVVYGGAGVCWFSSFQFRARNGFGAMRIGHGAVYIKNSRIETVTIFE